MDAAEQQDGEKLGSARPPDTAPDTFGWAVREFYRHRSAQILSCLFLLCLMGRVIVGVTDADEFGNRWDLFIVVALVAYWPLNEWLIHVVMLHYKPVMIAGRERDFLLPQTHRAHHRDPWNIDLVFIPSHVFPITVPVLFLLTLLLLPIPQALTFLATYLLLSAHYEWTHYLAHIRYCPSIGFYQRRVREHRQHHFLNERRWWGVSMGMGDRLLGTAPTRETVERSATVRTLGMPQPPDRCYRAMRTAPPA